MKKLFVIEDKFEIEGKGIALIGVPDDDAKKLEKGDVIIIKQGDAREINTQVLGFELMRNSWSPHKPRNMCVLISSEVGFGNIESKSELWASV